jgi:hypothetical protein
MKTNVIIVDDFYTNPDDVRKFALSQNFDVTGNWPGSRTKTFINESTQGTIAKILEPVAGKITDWGIADGFTGSFQFATGKDRSWMHTDPHNTWAGVLYLTPNAPLSGGTGLFKRKMTNNTIQETQDELLFGTEAQDMTKWELVDRIGNLYNRLVLYRGNLWHTSLDYFGSNQDDGRLFQVFFITTEY